MLLTVDIGNSSTKFGIFAGENLTSKFSIPTKRDATADEISFAVGDRLGSTLESAIVCSVVPEVDQAMLDYLRRFASDPVFVNNASDFALKIDYEPLDSLGTDRLVTAFAAVEIYRAPCIVCSLGTATTIDLISSDREFRGGIIAPGMDAMAEALHLKAPRLPRLDVEKPERLIGNTTMNSILSGVYNGYVAMVEGLITQVRDEAGCMRVIGTGGNAEGNLVEFGRIMRIDPDLLLNGLRILGSTGV